MTDVFWTMLGALSVFCNRIAEAVKAWLKLNLPPVGDNAEAQLQRDRAISLAALIVSFICGLVGAAVLNLNLVTFLQGLQPDNPYLQSIPPLAGLFGSAALASAGSEGLQWVTDLLSAARQRLLPGGSAG